ncbi:unnamed protein product [Pleuronectes platessa]|uniref:Uncharacterized protein n=1 Tax=Pleuronectes platessa TaxID=8262 RepID=A0A9N7U3D4_PLEPL|nr:unnamed protein product [Pleuronectes platessa]
MNESFNSRLCFRFNDLLICPQSELISPVTAVRAADGAYMHICETEVFSMGVFLLRPGASIPLHVHPDMNGNLRSNLIRKLPFQRIQLARRSRGHRA